MVNELITENKILKLSLLFIVFLAMSIYVSAQGIELRLIEYNPETSHARLQIRNLESKSLKNVSLIIDNSLPYFLVGALSPGNAIVHSKEINSGMHNLTVTANGGITHSTQILFTKSREQFSNDVINNNAVLKTTTTVLSTTSVLPTTSILPTTIPITPKNKTPSTIPKKNIDYVNVTQDTNAPLLISGLIVGVLFIVLITLMIYIFNSRK